MQTIDRALTRPAIRVALNGLAGCPAGGWAETDQAMRRIADALPAKAQRSYTLYQLVAAAMRLDHADRYQWR